MEILRMENIKAGYGDNIILEDISFSLREGELVALLVLMGPGKPLFEDNKRPSKTYIGKMLYK